jgi:hypothetical protein
MSEIKRTNEIEKYNTTAGWLNDFFSKVAKDTPPAPPIVTAKTEKFATIEEKMADIKSRVGFGSISGLTKESSSELKVGSSKKCKCNSKSCNCKEDLEKRLVLLKKLLNYVSSMLESEPHLLEAEVKARCEENKDLKLEDIKINPEQFSKFINNKIKSPKEVDLVYIKPEIETSRNMAEDIADYYRHSMPNLF